MEPNQGLNNRENGMEGGSGGTMSGGGTPNPIQMTNSQVETPSGMGQPVEMTEVESVEVTNEPVNPVAEPVKANENVAFQDKPKKKSHAMAFVVVLLVITTACGIGFGVWAMMDGNSRVAKKDEQIASLNSQITSLQQEKSELSDKVAELTQTNEQAQADIAADEEKIKEDEAIIAEDQQREAEGYQVKSIDACILDTGTVGGGSTVLKCDAVTSLGNGKFVYDSQSNKLRFVILQ